MTEEKFAKYCEIDNKIVALRAKMQQTNEKVLAHYEGDLSDEEYAEVVAQRKVWRAEINTLEELRAMIK